MIWFKFDKVSWSSFELRLWLDRLVQVWQSFPMFIWILIVTWPFDLSLIKFLNVSLNSDCDLIIWFKFDKVSRCLFELKLWRLVQVWWSFPMFVWNRIITYNKYHCKQLCVKRNFYFKRISFIKILIGKNLP